VIDSEKRTYEVKLRLTEQEFLDFSRIAEMRSRTLADQAHVIVRIFLYGHVKTLLKGLFADGLDEPKHKVELLLSDSDFINLSKIGVLKNKTLAKVILDLVNDSLNGHVARLNKVKSLFNKAIKD